MGRTDYLVVGHVARDTGDSGFTLGGSAIYASVAATQLGRRAAIVTACEPGIDLRTIVPKAQVSYAPSLSSTVFENNYRNSEREQYLHGTATRLRAEHVPPRWRQSSLVHIAPIAQELPADIVDIFTGSFIGLTPQGWLRAWDRTGKVFFKPWEEAAQVLPKVNAVVLSEEDVDYRADVISHFASLAPIMAVTQGESGVRIHWAGQWRHFPAFRVREVDATGAGDVFATAFFHRLSENRDPFEAAVFASCAASFAVEAKGISGIATADKIEDRLRGVS